MPSLVDIVQGNAIAWTQGSQATPTARTATADGTGTGAIAAGTSSVAVTCDSASKYITLPPPVAGNSIVLNVGSNGFRLQTTDPATIGINGVSGASSYIQVPANSQVFVWCLSATAFMVFIFTSTGGLDTGVDSYLGQTLAPALCHSGGVPATASTDGTELDVVVTELYLCEVLIPGNGPITGVNFMTGTNTNGNAKVMLFDSAGTRLAISASTDVSSFAADSYNKVPFSSVYNAKGPAKGFIGIICDDNTNDINTHTFGGFDAGKITGLVYATEAGYASITPPSTFTTGLGPIASLY